MITAQDLHALARHLVAAHGSHASELARRAVEEMAAQGDEQRHAAWSALRAVILDHIAGRLPDTARITLQ